MVWRQILFGNTTKFCEVVLEMLDTLVFYGAGENAVNVYKKFAQEGKPLPICICDSDINKANTLLHIDDTTSLKIFSLNDVLKLHPNAEFFVTPANQTIRFEIMQTLLDSGVTKDRIINFEPFSRRKSCSFLEGDFTIIGSEEVRICFMDYFDECLPFRREAPRVELSDDMSSEDMFFHFEQLRDKKIYELNNDIENCTCNNCMNLCTKLYSDKRKIKYFAFTAGYFCQYECIYCRSKTKETSIVGRDEKLRQTKRALEFLMYLKDIEIIDENTQIVHSNGEPALNPMHPELVEAFINHPCVFFTNGEIYSDEIERVLKKGRSHILVSVDSGTPETFKTVKGRACFDKVCENVKKYSKHGQVQLKYVLLPGINDKIADIEGFLKLVKESNASVVFSRDYLSDPNETFAGNMDSALQAITYFVNEANSRKIKFRFNDLF